MTVRASQLGALTDALAAVLPFKEPADSVLRGFFRHHRGLGQDDRAFIAEGVFAALRRLASLRVQAGSSSPRRLAIAATVRELGASLREIEGALSIAETAWAKEFKAAKPVLSPAEAAELPDSGTSSPPRFPPASATRWCARGSRRRRWIFASTR
jgi:16S rRNA (cytosine967-C5)-methyltransferase